MPRGPTRRIFVDYEVEARASDASPKIKKRVARQSERVWTSLSEANRNALLEHWRQMKEARREAETCRREAEQKGAEANNLKDAAQKDWPRIMSACLAAADAYRALHRVLEGSVDKISTFVNTVFEIHPNDDMTEYGDNLFRDELERVDAALASAGDFQSHADQPALPPRADGRLKFLERWIPDPENERNAQAEVNQKRVLAEQRRRTQLQNKLRETGILDNTWQGAWPIGNPGMSTTGLWVQINSDTNLVTDRVVRKDIYKTRRQWADATLWDGKALDGATRRPFEIACHEDLLDIPSTSSASEVHIPQVRATHVEDPLFNYTMYLEYCDLGTLNQLVGLYEYDERPIPEPFLWRTFHALAIAGLAMERGHLNRENKTKSNDWKEIVHRDLKPTNIFLSNERTDDFFASYPTPKVGHFGLAIKTSVEHDVLDPEIFLEQACTPDWTAPEQRAYVDLNTMEPVDRFKFSSKTNVWGKSDPQYTYISVVANSTLSLQASE